MDHKEELLAYIRNSPKAALRAIDKLAADGKITAEKRDEYAALVRHAIEERPIEGAQSIECTHIVPRPDAPRPRRRGPRAPLVVRLHDRAKEAATAFRRGYHGPYPIAPADLASPHREAWGALERAWGNYYEALYAAPPGTPIGRNVGTFRITNLGFGRRPYAIARGASGRKVSRLIELYVRCYAWRRVPGVGSTQFQRIGLLSKFGPTLGLRRLTASILARRFRLTKKQVIVEIRKFERHTKIR